MVLAENTKKRNQFKIEPIKIEPIKIQRSQVSDPLKLGILYIQLHTVIYIQSFWGECWVKSINQPFRLLLARPILPSLSLLLLTIWAIVR